MRTNELDDADLAEAAKEAFGWSGPSSLDGPENGFLNLDEGFGVVYSYAPGAGEILDESNYHAMLALIRKAAGSDADRDVQTGYVSHWTYSRFEIIEVRVYEPGFEPGRWDHVDEHPTDVVDVRYTAAFREAVNLALSMKRSYPVLDEDDYNERENTAWDAEIDRCIDWARRSYDLDTPAEEEQIKTLMFDLLREETDDDWPSIISPDGYRAECVDEDAITEWYRKARSEFFARRVADFWGDPRYLHRDPEDLDLRDHSTDPTAPHLF